jgi:hypothetical protein
MVVIVDWLRIYLYIQFNFIKMKTYFKKDGWMIELKGMVKEASL